MKALPKVQCGFQFLQVWSFQHPSPCLIKAIDFISVVLGTHRSNSIPSNGRVIIVRNITYILYSLCHVCCELYLVYVYSQFVVSLFISVVAWSSFVLVLAQQNYPLDNSGVPRNFVLGGVSTNSVEDRGQREWGSGGSSPLVRGSGGSCNLVQEISFHIVKFS